MKVDGQVQLPDTLENAKFTSMAWTHDNKGLFYNVSCWQASLNVNIFYYLVHNLYSKRVQHCKTWQEEVIIKHDNSMCIHVYSPGICYYINLWQESTKIHHMEKMAVIHFTTIHVLYLANLTEPLAHIESHILVKFISVLTKLCMQGLKFSDLFCAFLWAGFRIFVR